MTSWKFDNTSSFLDSDEYTAIDIDECTVTTPGKAIGPDCRRFINQMSSHIDRLEINSTLSGIVSIKSEVILTSRNKVTFHKQTGTIFMSSDMY